MSAAADLQPGLRPTAMRILSELSTIVETKVAEGRFIRRYRFILEHDALFGD